MNKIIGYEIASEVLKEPALFLTEAPRFWLIVDKDFPTNDGLPHFYFDEIPLLKNKTAVELRQIYRVKKEFPGSRIKK